MKYGKKLYYSSDADEVVNFKQKPIKIDENYNYITTNPFKKFFSWVVFYVFALPVSCVVFKVVKRVKFVNIKVLKPFKNKGYFVYANHTNQFGDGVCPALICFPQKPHIVVDSKNINIPIIGGFNKICGALPIPNNLQASKNFYNAIEHILKKNNPIIIYPEAHLWPYYTDIRNFPSTSFRYPVKFNAPVFTFTTVYKKRKFFKTPKVEIYIDGPYFVNSNLPEKEAQQELRNVVYNKLKERSGLSNYNFVNYIKRSKDD